MSVLADIQSALSNLGIPIETGVFTDKAPAKYIVVVPLADSFDLHADNAPSCDVQEARISLYTQGSYTKDKNAIVKALLAAELTVTDRRYIGYENDTGYHHYAVDVAQYYEMEE
nr:MAG TPA: Protein of unknown function (DUF806) [Caudoviricetes sp.]